MKKLLLSFISAILLTSSVAYSEEEKFDLIIRGEKLSFTLESLGESTKTNNMLNAFGGLNWTEWDLEKITDVLFNSGAKNVEVFSGGCLSRDSNNLLLSILNGSDETKIYQQLIEDSKKPCSINLTKSIPSVELIEKISSSNKSFIKKHQDLMKKLSNKLYKLNLPTNNIYNKEFIFDLKNNKNKKLITLGKDLEIHGQPIIIAGLPFKAVFKLSMNLIFFTSSVNRFNLKNLTDKLGYYYPYLLKEIELQSLSKYQSPQELNEKRNLIYQSLKAKYPKFVVEEIDSFNSDGNNIGYFKDNINNSISLDESKIKYQSGFFELGQILYVSFKQIYDKSKEEDLYKNQKDSTNNL